MNTLKVNILIFCGQLLLTCIANQVYSQVNNKPLPPGVLVDAGCHKLHLNIQGKGTPTVILENGSADFSFVWSLVQPGVAKFTKVVVYDRAGYTWSEPGPTPRTSRQICLELHTALHNAHIKGPYILVGQSFGGFLVRAFARYYPNEVVGMVLVEAIQENQPIFMGGDSPKHIRVLATGKIEPAPQSFFKYSTIDNIPPVKLDSTIDPPLYRLPDSIKKLQIWAQSQVEYRSSAGAEMKWSPEDVANIYKHRGEPAYMLGNIPLIVLTRGSGGYNGRADSAKLDSERLMLQGKLAHLSTNSKHIVDKNSGHNIHLEDPAIVIDAIKDVFISFKNTKKLY